MQGKALQDFVIDKIDDLKGQDIIALDVQGKSSSASMKKRSLPGSAGWSACGWRKRWVLTSLKCRWTRPTPDWRG
ncbi:hypothetical protein ONR07_24395, partial [Salmonella enterica subsp. enterica serovar Anatum]|nr:hypothetical protein [Salmonella enterica subsp. enterica serovar Anatum]